MDRTALRRKNAAKALSLALRRTVWRVNMSTENLDAQALELLERDYTDVASANN